MKTLRAHGPLILAALGLGLAVWLLNYPAYALGDRLESLSGGRLRFLHSEGTVWNGRAQLGLSDGGRWHALPDAVEWHWAGPGSGQGAGLNIQHPRLGQVLHLGWGSGGITISGGDMRLPASWLTALGAPFNTIRPEGVLQLSWTEMQVSAPDLNVVLLWQDAQSALASIRPLGEYRLEVKGRASERIELRLSTLTGALKMQGQGSKVPGGRMNFTGEAWSDETSKAALTGLLSQMGRLEGQRYTLGVF